MDPNDDNRRGYADRPGCESPRTANARVPDEWRGPKSNLDWEIEQARALLGEFAGMSEEELAMAGETVHPTPELPLPQNSRASWPCARRPQIAA